MNEHPMDALSFDTVLIIACGGAIGTVLRYLLSLSTQSLSRTLPWGTIGINILGSLLIGFFGTLTLKQGRFPLSDNARLFVLVGVCGGFTTFSSFSLQTFDLMRAGALGRGLLNIGLSVILCLAAVALGHFAADRLNGGAVQIMQSFDDEDIG